MSFTASPVPNAKKQFFDGNGVPLAGGSVTYYAPATTNPKTTWVDENQAVANPTTITLDAAGRAIVFGSGDYREIVKDSLGNTIWDQVTNVPPIAAGQVTGSQLALSGNVNAPAWLTAGSRLVANSATFTDTTSIGASGTIYADALKAVSVAAANVCTFALAYGCYFEAPTAGANVTLTTIWALGADSARINGPLSVTGTGSQIGSGAGAMLGVGVAAPTTTGYSGFFVGGSTTGFSVLAGAGGNFGINFTYNAGWKYIGAGAAAKIDLGETVAGDVTIAVANAGAAGGAITWVNFFQTGPNGTKFAQAGTTASAANGFLDNASSNLLLRSTSTIIVKTNVKAFGAPASGAIINASNPVTYTSLCEADDPTIIHYGLIAEDVAKYAPELCTWSPVEQLDQTGRVPDGYADWVEYIEKNAVNGKVPNNVQYDRFVPLLIAEVKSLNTENAALRSRQDAIEGALKKAGLL